MSEWATYQPFERRYAAVRAAARKYKLSDTLAALGWLATNGSLVYDFRRDLHDRTPWAIATLAKEALLTGNEHRNGAMPEDWASRLVTGFNNAFDRPPGATDLVSLISPIIYEQAPYQDSRFEEMARTVALMCDTPLPAAAGTDVADWTTELGIPLDDAVQAAFALWVWLHNSRGWLDPRVLDEPSAQDVYDLVSRESIETVARRLTATQGALRADYATAPKMPPAAERFSYNPLARTPIVDLGSRGLIAPQPFLVTQAISPGGLFYRGVSAWGPQFANQLGHRVEAYVGRQLGAVEGFDVHPEVTYGPKRNERKTIDWFVITPEAVVLVECKSRRLALSAKAGAAGLAEEYIDRLDKGRQQINTTYELIQNGDPAVSFVPTDRPVYGLVVTSEVFYLANDPAITSRMTATAIPTMCVSLRDLELWLSISADELMPELAKVFDDPEKHAVTLEMALPSEKVRNNAILQEAWDRLPLIAKTADEVRVEAGRTM
ncbi:hypothetical protein GXP71_00015 [Cellulomonas sp. H30R-01]|uniref:hypothetical protein n=1 Tax=Cellulomonas sp. H30R-01 TaxID=2704467 RepID=UPI00138BE17F|nr:hypothetical protein [Cellulomonas sp. H30R-01]QHT54642.1 hypothetical protein GXP71_00015 [Cellulomonas sp. H30R-01]